MAQNQRDWEDLGRNIQDVVDRAVNSHDFQKLNQTIRQVVDAAVDLGSEAVRQVTKPPVVEARTRKPALFGSTFGKQAKGIAKTAIGLPLGLIGGLSVLGSFASPLPSALMFVYWVLMLLLFAGGVGLSYSGLCDIGMVKRFRTYRRILGEKTHCSLEKLASGVGKSVKFVRRELQQMINQGLFLEGHLDHEGRSLITSHETYRYYEQSRRRLEEQKRQEAAKPKSAHTPQVQEILDKGNAFIAEIRRCNDAIPGEEISAKIDRMETIVRRIFQRAETNPEIVPDLKRMMDYYLPMTVKLLNAYADMDSQPIQGETIRASKQEIDATLDTLNLAFEKLLDSVFKDTALDVSSDISVLNTLLAQEGLTEDELAKMKKQHNSAI